MKVEEQAFAKVPLPGPSPTKASWQTPPSHRAHYRTTPALPETVDFLIIGSGISGTSIAWHLLSQSQVSVLILEARTACSGATGRNGGHTKAASYRSFSANVETLGEAEAIKIARLETRVVRATHSFAAEHKLQCDSNPCSTVDVYYDKKQWEAGLAAAKQMNEIMKGDQSTEVYTVLSKEEIEQKYYAQGALGGLSYQAGSINAYNFVMGMMELVLQKGCNLQTETPVTGICKTEGGLWAVKTGRGIVEAKNVVLATNGYTAHLEEAFQGVIVPLRGQMTAQRPGSKLPRPRLPTTYSFFYGEGYDYMVTTPKGDVMIGGAWSKLPDEGLSEFGETNDSAVNESITGFLESGLDEYFGTNWGEDSSEGRLKTTWSGIMGTSADGLPYTGAMPGKDGLWASASFNGHGMVMCFGCAEALVAMMLKRERDVQDWFPQSFKITAERLAAKFEGRRNVKPRPRTSPDP